MVQLVKKEHDGKPFGSHVSEGFFAFLGTGHGAEVRCLAHHVLHNSNDFNTPNGWSYG